MSATSAYQDCTWGIYGENEALARVEIFRFWDHGQNSAEIARQTVIPEHRVSAVISDYVTSKRFRASPF